MKTQSMSTSIRHSRLIALIAVATLFTLAGASATAQTVSTWGGGAGNWSDCPPGGDALWNTCPDPPNGLGWPNGNFDAVINGGPVAATSASIVNLTINSGGSLVFPAGVPSILDITGTSIVNNGSITLAGTDGMAIIAPAAVTMSGTGSVTMAGNDFGGSNGGGATLILQQPLEGYGSFGRALNLTNQSTIEASGGTLYMQPGSVTNTGTMEASSGGILEFASGVPTPYTNTGGVIKALNGGTVQIDDTIVTGGTLTTVGTGVIQANNSAVLNALTNSGTVLVSYASLQGTVTNTGTMQVPNRATLFINGNAALTGSGSLIMSGSSTVEPLGGNGGGTLTNQELIHGSGTIYEPLTNQGTIAADSKGNSLSLDGGAITNTSALKAENGGILDIYTTVNNRGGTIEALTGSTVILTNEFNGSVNGGTLTTSGSGVIESENGVLDGTVNIPTNAGKLAVNNYDLYIQGTINNTGLIALTGNSCVLLNEPATLTGSGTLTMVSDCISGSGNAFANASTIEGSGSIGDSNPMPISNSGTILATSPTIPLVIEPNSSGFTNTGTLEAKAGCTLTVKGPFSNLSGAGALVGGTYSVTGTLGLPGAVVSNGAKITLNGAKAEIVNTGESNNALASLASNTTTGTLTVESGQALATATSFSNAGKTVVAAGSIWGITGSYTQTGGSTTVDGTLTASSGITLTKGSLVGKGTLGAAVSSNASVTAGDSSTKPATLSITGTYKQESKAALNISVGGTAAGTFGALAVTNGVSLGGTLNIKLINGFVPGVGDSFTIITGSAITGDFARVNGETINSSEHFEVNHSGTAVTLTVASGS